MKKIFLFIISVFTLIGCNKPIPLDQWTYIEVDSNRSKWGDYDEPEWLRYFGLDAKDLNGDGYKEILSGKYLYLNPGDAMTKNWERIEFELNIDAMLFIDVDEDEYPDIIAEALPNVYWIEATNSDLSDWNYNVVCQIPRTGHVNGQGYMIADIFEGDKPEIILATQEGPYAIEIPKERSTETWKSLNLFNSYSDEGFDIIDIDGDGDIDLVGADRQDVDSAIDQLFIYINPGDKTTPWEKTKIAEGTFNHDFDRISTADLNGDGLADVVASEERYPGHEPDANLYLFISPEDPLNDRWKKVILITQFSMNNLDVGDVDKDGDIDIITNEHKGSTYKLQIFENDGSGNFKERLIDTGKECHLGAQLFDMDNDGDLDIIGHAWDNYKFLHLWRNDAIMR